MRCLTVTKLKRTLPLVFVFSFLALLRNLVIVTSGVYDRVNPGLRPVAETGSEFQHLVVVAGHSVLDFANALEFGLDNDQAWHLLEYQINIKFPSTIIDQIKRGVQTILDDPAALLVFSGGATRPDAGMISEAASYLIACELIHSNDAGENGNTWELEKNRILTEDFARDSFENVLFSIARFKEFSGNYPTKLSVVSLNFKETRFLTLHRAALRFPIDSFNFIPVEIKDQAALKNFKYFEEHYSLQPFMTDPYGCFSEKLQQKRIERNPFKREAPYILSCPEISGLLDFCGPGFYDKDLPW